MTNYLRKSYINNVCPCERNEVKRGNLSLVVRIAGLLPQRAGKIAALYFVALARTGNYVFYPCSVPGTSGSLLTVAGRFLPRTCTKMGVPGAANSVLT